VALDEVQWTNFVNTVTNLRVLKRAGNFLTGRMTAILSVATIFHGISFSNISSFLWLTYGSRCFSHTEISCKTGNKDSSLLGCYFVLSFVKIGTVTVTLFLET
jgi:hypothetical protein